MFEKLKNRWGILSNLQLIVIFIVFAINGTLSARIGYFILDCIGYKKEFTNLIVYYLLFIVIVSIIYPFLIMIIGYVFGQFDFFFKFGKKMLKSIGLGFIFKD
jgi:manganese efflux pump family protein